MLQWSKTIEYNSIARDGYVLPQDTLMYDIETTGLSPKNSIIYLIGFCYQKDHLLFVQQFFAETIDEEFQILDTFLDEVSRFPKTISFNGLRFDEPFIRARCEALHIDDTRLSYQHFDIYKECKRIKSLLNLPNLKQKTVEKFLGVEREDLYSGGELIKVYKDYLLSKDSQSLELLQLHNYEDVIGMVQILPILSYFDLKDVLITDLSYELKTYQNFSGEVANEMEITATVNVFLPSSIRIKSENSYLLLSKNQLSCLVSLHQGSLNHYLSNYKDYYYLPEEDMIILKQIAQNIPKERKKAATKENCYIKKEGLFLVLPEKMSTSSNIHIFKDNHKSKTESVLLDEINNKDKFFEEYCKQIITNSL